ncbi:hypothetical protein T11_10350, partial [Trichinella zimbabwensis]
LMSDILSCALYQIVAVICSLYCACRVYKLKHTGKQKKYWGCSKDKKGCKDAMWTNLEVTARIIQKDHIETCLLDRHLEYEMKKRPF